jgi:hypothetical protein
MTLFAAAAALSLPLSLADAMIKMKFSHPPHTLSLTRSAFYYAFLLLQVCQKK